MEPVFLTLDDALEMHDEQIERYGGTHGIRDLPGLESALAVPQATFDGIWLHDSIPAMAAAYLFHLCQNHAFLDGNKRIGANAAITFLILNGWDLRMTEEELVNTVLGVASGVIGKRRLTEIFVAHCVERGE